MDSVFAFVFAIDISGFYLGEKFYSHRHIYPVWHGSQGKPPTFPLKMAKKAENYL